MVKIKPVLLSDEEEKILRAQHGQVENPELDIEEIIKTNKNQTLLVLRQLKPLAKFDDIEDIVNYVDVIKKFESNEEVDLTENEVKTVIKAFENAVASKEINGYAYERVVQVYRTFK